MGDMEAITEARLRLIETGGRTSQDLGAGRIVGQVLVYLYLQERECSLDTICEELDLSKASVSIGVRQLEQLGFTQKVSKKGDRKSYYRSADNIASALQKGLLSIVRQKVQLFGGELDGALELLDAKNEKVEEDTEVVFLKQRISRARQLQRRLDMVMGNPLFQLLAGVK